MLSPAESMGLTGRGTCCSAADSVGLPWLGVAAGSRLPFNPVIFLVGTESYLLRGTAIFYTEKNKLVQHSAFL